MQSLTPVRVTDMPMMLSLACLRSEASGGASISTGKQRDTESGNDYFLARYFSSDSGRFLTPDWSKNPQGVPYADYTNPQTLNLYGYVNNNPLSHVDKDGHDATADFLLGAGTVLCPECLVPVGVATAAVLVYQNRDAISQDVQSLAGSIASYFSKSDNSTPAATAPVPADPADAKAQEPTSSSGGETAGQKFKPGDRAEDAGKKCVYCGRQTTEEPGKENSRETDHGDPRSRGGNAEPENRNPSCRTCNRQKGTKTPEEFKEWQKRNPDKVPKAFLIFPHWRGEEEWLPIAA